MNNFPKGTTHVWTAAREPRYGVVQLNAYKKDKQKRWWVYSEITGWRLSQNDDEWFATETEEGYFVTLAKYNKNGK
jgi:hypothetical protein